MQCAGPGKTASPEAQSSQGYYASIIRPDGAGPSDTAKSTQISAFGFDSDDDDDDGAESGAPAEGSAFDFSDLDAALDKASGSEATASVVRKRAVTVPAAAAGSGPGEEEAALQDLVPTCISVNVGNAGRPSMLPEFYLYAEQEPLGRNHHDKLIHHNPHKTLHFF